MNQEKPVCVFTAQMGTFGSRALVPFPRSLASQAEFTYSARQHQTGFIGFKERGGPREKLTHKRARIVAEIYNLEMSKLVR